MIWVDIPGYEGMYQISSEGSVKSLSRKFSPGVQILAPIQDQDGYVLANLYKDRVCYLAKVHRLVALSFIDNPESKKEVNHKNGNKSDNRVSNLEWVTTLENQEHSYKKLGRINNGGVQPLSIPVIGTSINGKHSVKYKSRSAAQEDGFHAYSITKCLLGEYKQHKGYIWRKAS